jgi:magnesium chelatase subunit D
VTRPEDLAALSDPALAALLLAVDPHGLGGIALRARSGPVREHWLAQLRHLIGLDIPLRRLPLHAGDSRLFGGLDLAATLAAGRPVAERGILAETDGGLLLLAMAERISGRMAGRLCAVLDSGVVILERDGFAARAPARIGMVALDEGIEAEERPPPALLERLAFWVDLDRFDPSGDFADWQPALAAARRLYAQVEADAVSLTSLAETAAALGIASLRADILALRTAKAAAALAGRRQIEAQDAALAARLVLAPRATRLPVDPQAEAQPQDDQQKQNDPQSRPASQSETSPDDARTDTEVPDGPPPGDIVLAAARAALPPGLLLQLQAGQAASASRQTQGRAGARHIGKGRGRPTGVRPGHPADGAPLNLIETLRAAAPWQKLRGAGREAEAAGGSRRIAVRRDDLRITRLEQRSETVTIFVVDASGSLAINRLAEAKGAVELLLADCYVRRDQVALLAFRGRSAELVLPPTRSLARAKRCLAELPGGGGTPLATAIEAAMRLAEQIRRRGQTPVAVFLTDGRANVARDGVGGRGRAEEDARLAAQAAALSGIRMLVVDAALRPQPPAQRLATTLGALYLPLPRAEAGLLSKAIRTVAAH